MHILKLVKDYTIKGVKWIFSNLEKSIIILLIIVLAIVGLRYCSTQKELAKTKAELVESADTLTTYKNKIGELYLQRETYITDAKTLKYLNDSLYKEYKSLKDHPTIITKTETVLKIDSVYIADTPVEQDTVKNTYTANFDYNDKWFSINGKSVFNLNTMNSSTTINNLTVPANFTTNLIEKDKKLYFVTKSDNPYIQINNIEGAVISPENSKLLNDRYNKPWVVAVGAGPSLILIDGKLQVYPSINLTLGYKIIDFKL